MKVQCNPHSHLVKNAKDSFKESIEPRSNTYHCNELNLNKLIHRISDYSKTFWIMLSNFLK